MKNLHKMGIASNLAVGSTCTNAMLDEVKRTDNWTKTISELENIGYTACDFKNECDVCKEPKGRTFMVGYINDMCGEECDYYICRKCAELSYEERKKWLESQ